MARPRKNHKVVCQNNKCGYYRLEIGKDIIARGINKAGHRQYKCLYCNTYFTDTKGTPLFNLKTPERKVKEICTEFMEGKGIRSIERKVHIHRDTICTILDKLGKHAKELTEYLVHDLKLSTYEVDELFATIQKKRKGLSQREMNSLAEARKSLQHA
jgi:transposase-like protein